MESAFAHDFSRVRIHADPSAARSASLISSRAYTVGTDIVFGPQEYAPETERGNRLLAHELTHVVQQSTRLPIVQRKPLRDENESVAGAQASSPLTSVFAAEEAIRKDATAALESSLIGLTSELESEILTEVITRAIAVFQDEYDRRRSPYILPRPGRQFPEEDLFLLHEWALKAAWAEFVAQRDELYGFIGIYKAALSKYARLFKNMPEEDVIALRESVAAAALRRYRMLRKVLSGGQIELATSHISGVVDTASPKANVKLAILGKPAMRSSYGTAPGGSVELDNAMIEAMVALTEPPHSYTFHVTEIAGGSHSTGSRHYRGVTFDADRINGQAVSIDHPDQLEFRAACRELGARQVLGPGDPGHGGHIHAAWPKP